jgi:hypothetical protein
MEPMVDCPQCGEVQPADRGPRCRHCRSKLPVSSREPNPFSPPTSGGAVVAETARDDDGHEWLHPFSGARPAAVLLWVNAGLALLTLFYALTERRPFPLRAVISCLVDVVLAVGVWQRNEQFRIYALARIVVFGLVFAVFSFDQGQPITGSLELASTAAMSVLLFGAPRRPTVVAATLVAAISLVGPTALAFAAVLLKGP